MKPIVHSRIHAKKWGGVPEDYLPIDDFMDSTKMAIADVRHRMVLYNAVGCFIAERVFGHTIVNSDGKEVSVRDIAEQHVIQDLGFIPSLDQCFKSMKIENWMGGKVSKYAEESKPQPVLIKETPTPDALTPHTGQAPQPLPTTTGDYHPPTGTSVLSILTDTSLIPRNEVFIDGTRPPTSNGEKYYD